MAVTMYSGFVPVCLQLLGGLKTVLKKAEEHATAQKWDTTVVLNLRLFPDMFPLERQVRQVCTHSCGAGRVAGVSLPSFPDQDNSFAEMQARIDKTVDFLKGLRADQLDGKDDTVIRFRWVASRASSSVRTICTISRCCRCSSTRRRRTTSSAAPAPTSVSATISAKCRRKSRILIGRVAQHTKRHGRPWRRPGLPGVRTGANETKPSDSGDAAKRRRKHGTKGSWDFHGVR